MSAFIPLTTIIQCTCTTQQMLLGPDRIMIRVMIHAQRYHAMHQHHQLPVCQHASHKPFVQAHTPKLPAARLCIILVSVVSMPMLHMLFPMIPAHATLRCTRGRNTSADVMQITLNLRCKPPRSNHQIHHSYAAFKPWMPFKASA